MKTLPTLSNQFSISPAQLRLMGKVDVTAALRTAGGTNFQYNSRLSINS